MYRLLLFIEQAPLMFRFPVWVFVRSAAAYERFSSFQKKSIFYRVWSAECFLLILNDTILNKSLICELVENCGLSTIKTEGIRK